MNSKQFSFYILSGGVAGLLNWGSRFIFSEFLSFEVAIALAFTVGLLSGFILMRIYVFQGVTKPILPQFSKYLIINFFALIQTFLVSIFLARWIMPSFGIVEYSEGLSHLIGVLTPVMTSYFGHKFVTFR